MNPWEMNWDTPQQVGKPWEMNYGPAVSPEASYSTADEVSGPQSFKIGAGRTVDKWLKGIQQGGMQIGHLIGSQTDKTALEPKMAALTEEQTANDQAYRGLQERHPFATAAGEVSPYAGIPPSMGGLGAAATVGALEGMKYGTPAQRASNAVMGAGTAGLGNITGKGISAFINPVPKGAVTETSRNALKDAIDLGIKPRLSQITGGKYASQLEDFAAQTPGGMGTMANFNAGNQQAINKAMAKAIGQPGYNELSPSVLAQAHTDTGAVFEEIKALGKVPVNGRMVNPITIDPSAAGVANDILRQQSKMIAGQQDPKLVDIARQTLALANNKGRIDGEAYQLLRSGLSEASYDASGTNRDLYGKLLEAVDNSAQKSLRSLGYDELATNLQMVRPQYSALKSIEKGRVAEKGNVDPQRLAGALRQTNPKLLRTGDADTNDVLKVARYGENFPPIREGSQTYQRQNVSNPLSTVLKAPFAYGAAKLTTSPLALAYPRIFGGTKGAELAAALAQPAGRALPMASAEIIRRALMSGVPINAENQ